MADLVHFWKKMSLKLFFPEDKRNLFWLLVGPTLLLCSALVLLVSFAPLQTLLLVIGALFLLVSYFAPKKVAQLFLGLTVLFAIFCLREKTTSNSAMDFFWTVQFLLALYVAQQTIFTSKEYSESSSALREDLDKDAQLWKSRFDTLREKIDSDREVWETEIEDAREKAQEKNDYAESLRRLIQTANAQIRKLEESPLQDEEFDQMALLQDRRLSFLSTIDHMAVLSEKEENIQVLQEKLEEKECNSSSVVKKDQEIEKLTQLLKIAQKQKVLSSNLREKEDKIEELEQLIEVLEKEHVPSCELREKEEKIEELEQLIEVLEKEHVPSCELREKEDKIEELEELLQIIEEEGDNLVIEGKEITQEGVLKMLTQLNEVREQNYQLELLLSNAKEKYEELENAFESRRTRNQELLTTSNNKTITLQSLSKKAKSR